MRTIRRGAAIMSPIATNEVNHCPGCGRSHWYVGRLSAECGFCGTALPLTESLEHRRRPVPLPRPPARTSPRPPD